MQCSPAVDIEWQRSCSQILSYPQLLTVRDVLLASAERALAHRRRRADEL